MRAKYIGDPKHDGAGRKTLRLFGIAFPHGQWVSIDGNAAALLKLPNNSHFQVDKGEAPASPAKPAAAPVVPPKNKGGRPRKNPQGAPPVPAASVADATDDDLEEPEGADDGFSDLDEPD